jgi:small-conductance mechanosensitive channel
MAVGAPLAEWVGRVTDSDALVALVGLALRPVLTVAGIVLLASVASRLARRALRRIVTRVKDVPGGRLLELGADASAPSLASARRAQRTEALGTLADSVVRAVIWGLAVLTALGTLGVDLGPLIAGAGVVGIALGFGAQNLVRDLLAGVSMLLEDQYGVGDVIDVGDATGVVEAVGLRTTRLRDLRGTVWHVPNGAIARVGNLTQGWSRAVVEVGVAYGADMATVEEVLRGVLERFAGDEAPGILLEPPELVGVESLADSSVVLRLVAKTLPGEQWMVARRLRRAVKLGLDAAGIEIPFPQRTLHVRTDPDGGVGQAVGPPG